MADFCSFCDTRRPQGGTNMLVLNGGSLWLEFCSSCGDNHILTNQNGKHQTLNQIFSGSEEDAPALVVAKHFARINLADAERRKTKAKYKRLEVKAKAERRAKYEAGRNTIGNMFPDLKGMAL